MKADRVALILEEARVARRRLSPLPKAIAPANEAEGYAAQAALAARIGAMPPAGFKVGATARAMQAYLGIDAPIAGFMPHEWIFRTGATTPFARWVAPGVECEIAVRLGADIAPGATLGQVADAIADIFPAIEIVENRYDDFTTMGLGTLVADQMFHAGAVLGDAASGWDAARLAGGDPAGLRGRMTIDGALFGEGVGADLMGHPLEVVRWLAGSPAARLMGGLHAGQVVLCGSVTPPAWLAGPAEVVVAFEGLGEVSVRFT